MSSYGSGELKTKEEFQAFNIQWCSKLMFMPDSKDIADLKQRVTTKIKLRKTHIIYFSNNSDSVSFIFHTNSLVLSILPTHIRHKTCDSWPRGYKT